MRKNNSYLDKNIYIFVLQFCQVNNRICSPSTLKLPTHICTHKVSQSSLDQNVIVGSTWIDTVADRAHHSCLFWVIMSRSSLVFEPFCKPFLYLATAASTTLKGALKDGLEKVSCQVTWPILRHLTIESRGTW